MAKNVSLPSGFVLDTNEAQLPAGFAVDTVPQQDSLMNRMKGILEARGQNIRDLQAGKFNQPAAFDAVQALGEVGAGVGEAGGELFMSGVKAVTPDSIEDAVAKSIAESDWARELGELMQAGGEEWEQFSQRFPSTARNIEAIGGVASGVGSALGGTQVGKAFLKAGDAAIDKTGEIGMKTAENVRDALKQKPTFEDVKNIERSAWEGAYKAAEETGAKIDGKNITDRFNFNIKNTLDKDAAIDPDLHPSATTAMTKLADEIGFDEVTPQKVQIARRKLNALRESSRDMGKATDDTRLMNDIIASFDDAVDGAASAGKLSQNKAVNDMFKEARKVSRTKYKAELLNDAFERAERAGSSFDRAIKNEFRNIANNKRKMRQFTKQEQKLIDEAAKTGLTEQAVRSLSVFDPTSGKLSAGIGLGAAGATGSILIPALGVMARAGTEKIAGSRGKKVLDKVLSEIELDKPSVMNKEK